MARDVNVKTLFLAEGEKHVLEALHLLLAQQAEYEILGEVRSAERLLAHVCQHSPDAILLDWHLPGFHPHRLIPTLRECCPITKLIALSVKPEYEKAAKQYGLDGFISKQIPAESLLQALSAILFDEEITVQTNAHGTNGN
ncbi:MAG: response regulator transcription factor [Chloroflexota bacterium]